MYKNGMKMYECNDAMSIHYTASYMYVTCVLIVVCKYKCKSLLLSKQCVLQIENICITTVSVGTNPLSFCKASRWLPSRNVDCQNMIDHDKNMFSHGF